MLHIAAFAVEADVDVVVVVVIVVVAAVVVIVVVDTVVFTVPALSKSP